MPGPSPQTTATVLAELHQIIADEVRVGSRLALFPALYAEFTQRVILGLAAGEFREPVLLERLVVRFAQRYFDALATFRRAEAPSKSWRVAFEQARGGRMLCIQDLVLGINAHINLDLSIATAEVAEGDLAAIEPDFLRINLMLEELFNGVQDTLSRHSPLLDVLDRVGRQHDELLGNFVIARARDAAWSNARVLSSLDERLRPTWIGMLDITTARLGHMVSNPGFVMRKALELVQSTEERDVSVLVRALAEVQP